MGELVNYSVLRKTLTFSSDMPLTHFFKLPPLLYFTMISFQLADLIQVCLSYKDFVYLTKEEAMCQSL
jgi:hypothetical protein